MDSIIITWRELLLVLAAVLAVYVAEMLLLLRGGGNAGWRRWQRGAQAHAQAQALAELRAQIEALRAESSLLRSRLEQLESDGASGLRPAATRLADSAEVSQAPMAAAQASVFPEGVDTPYGHAIRMAREGRAVAEVAGDCRISRGEAELIVALYRSTSPH
jgi:hypothetical protein